MDDVKKLRELLANASPGPWFVSNERRCIDAGFVGDDGAIYDGPSYGPLDQNDPKWTADAALIAAAVNALPALLDEVERLRRVEVAAQRFNPARLGCICHLTSVPPCAACELRAALPASAFGGEG